MATRATVKDIKSAVRSVVGFVPAELRVAEQYVVRDALLDCARDASLSRPHSGKSFNGLDCEQDAEIADSETLDAALLQSLNYTRGVLLDLYVYSKSELETNVSVVIGSDGEVLTCYDNVGHFGYVCDEWWCGREVES